MLASDLLTQVSQCVICEAQLPLGARPVVQFNPSARILIAGQAPGLKVHQTGIPFDDASGQRLRQWLGLSKDDFYDATKIAILPMGFCYPGKGKSGDLPPRKECAPAWRAQLLAALPNIKLTIVLGKYAQAYHLPQTKHLPLTELVKSWREYWPTILPLPHPSPRNNIWLANNPWFERDVVPQLAQAVQSILKSQGD
ncbi:MAG TPA: uracil-DNA glycosylase family protein [Pseudoalteromonas prydzensis]|uniref:Uracil-DNA glycosylase family protein n=1 Tax=Pseudoalteromonas prydzensis TaxID=182141 RepID=A0A7V1CYL5_9GAMM|nr:uracil-DNA glycosylase family protein [Pseudoalteromonas prydzensis]HEA16604.1 uracil-DNA glycosylase family protein [Pseudoalteromonas prydzensis]